MGQSEHDKIANRLARQEGTKYNKGKGPDIISRNRVIEVAASGPDIKSSISQVRGYKQPKYIATPSKLIPKAKEITQGTKIGVKGPTGTTAKRAGGGRRK